METSRFVIDISGKAATTGFSIMIDLKRNPKAHWIDLAQGVTVKVRPMSDVLWDLAGEQGLALTREWLKKIPKAKSDDAAVRDIGFSALLRALAIVAIVDWKEVRVDGKAQPVSRDGIIALMDHPVMMSEFIAKYYLPWIKVAQSG